jgi:ATP-dependent RNA helicase DeaD
MKNFKELGLSEEILKSLAELNYSEAMPIQEKAIPFILENKQDLIGLAQTGTGKTAAFGLPVIEKIIPNKDLQALILCPTRELCLQISKEISAFSKYKTGLKIATIYGGARIDLQMRELNSGVNIVVGTPGRVGDMIRRKKMNLKNISYLILDEADEMLDLGFKEELDNILVETPSEKQTLLFSATMSSVVRKIANKYMSKPQEIKVGKTNEGADNVSHKYYLVKPRAKFEALRRIVDSEPDVYGILFCRTRNETQEIANKLKESNYSSEALHGDVSQNMRTQIMERFRNRKIQLLVATDVAARGIDVNDLTHVINYNLPETSESYVHRSGRTGRINKDGLSISIITPYEERKIRTLEKRIGKKFELKKIPTGKEICNKQILNLMERVKNVKFDEKEIESFVETAEEILGDLSKKEIISKFLAVEFNHFLNQYKEVNDMEVLSGGSNISKERMADSNLVDVKINVGKSDKFDVKTLFRLINSSKELKGAEIGKIKIEDAYTVFGLEKNRAKDVDKAFSKVSFAGKFIKTEVENVKSERRERREGNERKGRNDRRGGNRKSSGRGSRNKYKKNNSKK